MAADPITTAVETATGAGAAASPWLAAIPVGMGVVQGIGGLLGLNKLKKQKVPQFTEDPNMATARKNATVQAGFGFSPEQVASYNAQQQQLNNSRWNRAITIGGGNQSRAISAGLNYGNIGANLNFAAKNQQVQENKMRYADTFARNLQDLRNRNTQNAYNYRMQSEQALGKAVQSGFNNIATGAMMYGVSKASQPQKNASIPNETTASLAPQDLSQYSNFPTYTEVGNPWGGVRPTAPWNTQNNMTGE